MPRNRVTALIYGLSLAGLLAATVPARGQFWFDAGGADTTTVYAPEDSTCWERFPPTCMGPLPERSFVAQTISLSSCAELRWPGQVCGREGSFVRGFRILFNDGGCGCGGYVEPDSPTTLRLSYDPARLPELGLRPGDLQLVYNDERTSGWRPVPEYSLDPSGPALMARIRGKILGLREYAIVGAGFVPATPTTWSALKAAPAPERR